MHMTPGDRTAAPTRSPSCRSTTRPTTRSRPRLSWWGSRGR